MNFIFVECLYQCNNGVLYVWHMLHVYMFYMFCMFNIFTFWKIVLEPTIFSGGHWDQYLGFGENHGSGCLRRKERKPRQESDRSSWGGELERESSAMQRYNILYEHSFNMK